MRRPLALFSVALMTCVGVGVAFWRHRPVVITAEPAPATEDSGEPIGELEIDSSENGSELHSLPLAAAAPTHGDAGVDSFLAQPAALERFYLRVAASLRGEGGVVRVAHYGDSLITSDYLSGTARRLLQRDLGDGGHGFLAIANPWEWYFHNDVAHTASRGWRQSRITGPLAKDHAYGPGGVVFRGSAGASAVFGTAKEGPFGRKVARFLLLYAARPGGGEVELKSGETTQLVDTDAEQEAPRVAVLEVAKST